VHRGRLWVFFLSVGNPAECVCYHICCTWVVLDFVVVLLEFIQVTPLAARQLILAENVLQCCVVGKYGSASASMDVAGPVFQIRTDCEEFSVVCWVSHLHSVKFP